MAKSNKNDRRNDFIMRGAAERASARVRAYLSKNSFKLSGVEDFDAAMDAIVKALMQIYSDAMCDTLDVIDGRNLPEIK